MPQSRIRSESTDNETSRGKDDLSSERLYLLGYAREVVDFAVYHSDDNLLDAVDNLLEACS